MLFSNVVLLCCRSSMVHFSLISCVYVRFPREKKHTHTQQLNKLESMKGTIFTSTTHSHMVKIRDPCHGACNVSHSHTIDNIMLLANQVEKKDEQKKIESMQRKILCTQRISYKYRRKECDGMVEGVQRK